MKNSFKKTAIFLFPFILGVGLFLLFKKNLPLYEKIGLEDGLLEWIQFILFSLSTVLAIMLAFKFRQNRALVVIYIIVALGMFFVASEEISWGERIIEVGDMQIIPEHLMGRNVQGETNFHNIDTFDSKVGYIYTVIGMWGVLSGLFLKMLKKCKKVKKSVLNILGHITNPWHLSMYFFPLFINLITTYEFKPQHYEVTETFLSIGIFLFLLDNYLQKEA
jgi:hypothetical protein